MQRKLVIGVLSSMFGFIALVGAEPPAASQPQSLDLIIKVEDSGGDCLVIIGKGENYRIKKDDVRQLYGGATGKVTDVWAIRAKIRVANAKCADVEAAYKAARQPKKEPTAEEIAKEHSKKCEAEKDRIASTPRSSSVASFRYAVYKAGTKAPAKCTGEIAIKVDGKDCGYRYCSWPAGTGN